MKNIGWMLRQRATVSPRLQAYVEPSTDVRMTYAQMNALANRCATCSPRWGSPRATAWHC